MVCILLLLPTIQSNVLLLEIACQCVLLQSFKALPCGLVLYPITLTFSWQQASFAGESRLATLQDIVP